MFHGRFEGVVEELYTPEPEEIWPATTGAREPKSASCKMEIHELEKAKCIARGCDKVEEEDCTWRSGALRCYVV